MTAPRSERWWERLGRDLLEPADAAEIDALIAGHLSGSASEPEKARLAALARADPAVAELLAAAGAVYLAEGPKPSGPQQPRRTFDQLLALAATAVTLAGHLALSAHFTGSHLARLDYWEEFAWIVSRYAVVPAVVIVLAGYALTYAGFVRRHGLFNVIALGVFAAVAGGVWLYSEGKQAAERQRLEEVLMGRRWVTYEPPGFNPYTGEMPTAEDVERQLALLHDPEKGGGFDGLITFNSEGVLAEIPRLAKKVGFKSVIMGIYIPKRDGKPFKPEEQLRRAAAQREHADAYCLGHNAVRDLDLSVLAGWMAELRSETGRPVATTAPLTHYLGARGQELRSVGDFYFPDVVPEWRAGDSPREALASLQRSLDKVNELPPEKCCLLKMVSYPSGGSAMASEAAQAEFFRGVTRDLLLQPLVGISLFNGFDLPWKRGPDWDRTEQYTGLFDDKERPKPAVEVVRKGFPVHYKP